MFRTILCVVVVLFPALARCAEVRTWTDETGEFEIAAKFSGVESGKLKLLRKDGSILKANPDKLSDADQEFLNKQLEALDAKRFSHTGWGMRVPQIKTGFALKEFASMSASTIGPYQMPYAQSTTYQVPYAYKTYGYTPLQAVLIAYKGSDVTLQNNGGQGTFKYANFAASDQKFLAEYRLLEKETGPLAEIDLPKSYAPSDSAQLMGQYDLGNGQFVNVGPGTIDSNRWGSGTWIYDERLHRHRIHWHDGREAYAVSSSKGNLHIKDELGHITARRVSLPQMNQPSPPPAPPPSPPPGRPARAGRR